MSSNKIIILSELVGENDPSALLITERRRISSNGVRIISFLTEIKPSKVIHLN